MFMEPGKIKTSLQSVRRKKNWGSVHQSWKTNKIYCYKLVWIFFFFFLALAKGVTLIHVNVHVNVHVQQYCTCERKSKSSKTNVMTHKTSLQQLFHQFLLSEMNHFKIRAGWRKKKKIITLSFKDFLGTTALCLFLRRRKKKNKLNLNLLWKRLSSNIPTCKRFKIKKQNDTISRCYKYVYFL